MSNRSEKKQRELAGRQGAQFRATAADDARALALDIVGGNAVGVTAYGIGVVLDADEIVWRESVPGDWFARATIEWPNGHTEQQWQRHPVRPWMVTNHRVISRQPDGSLCQVQWAAVTGCRVDLATEVVVFDATDGWQGGIGGPGVAVIAVAAVASVYGPQALIDHPGIAPLRSTPWTYTRPAGADEGRTAISDRSVSF